jgi:peptidoglycan hydrolase FlgJ
LAISPSSDLVLGVTQAADPAKAQSAADRLRRLSEAVRSADTSAQQIEASQPAAPVLKDGSAPRITQTARGGRAAQAFSKLEAFILQSFIQAMLPKNASKVFGKGIAGEYWKSMMAEKLGAELARSGRVGLAAQLAAGRPESVEGAASPVTASTASLAPRASDSLLSVLPYLSSPAPDTDAAAEQNSPPANRS